MYPDRWGALTESMVPADSFLRALRVVRSCGIELLLYLGHLGFLMDRCVKRVNGARHIFAMRIFWPDERVDGGVWRRRGLVCRIVNWLEARLLLGADCVMSRPEAETLDLRRFKCLSGRATAVEVVPTWGDLDLFKPAQRSAKGFAVAYVGPVGTWC